MNIATLISFNPDVIPWPTYSGDWNLCLNPEFKIRVWVECKLIKHVLIAKHLDCDDLLNISEALTTIGGKIVPVLERLPVPLEDGHVRAMRFTGSSIDMRVGQFDSDIFVFLPKPEFEQ